MADNYLEKQMEQYQARKAAWERERKYGKKKVSSTPKNMQQQQHSEHVPQPAPEKAENNKQAE